MHTPNYSWSVQGSDVEARPRTQAKHGLWLTLPSLLWAVSVFACSIGFLLNASVQQVLNPASIAFAIGLGVLFLIAWIVTLVLGRRFDARKKTPIKDSPFEGAKTALLLVHGIGVQDRYQMLSQFKDGLEAFSSQDLTVYRHHDPNVDAYQLVPKDKEQRFDVFEAFWGHHFNGLTKAPGIAIFGIKILFKTLPTLFSRVGGKRTYDFLWVLCALSALIFSLGFAYSGFLLCAKQFERIEERHFLVNGKKAPEMAVASMVGAEVARSTVEGVLRRDDHFATLRIKEPGPLQSVLVFGKLDTMLVNAHGDELDPQYLDANEDLPRPEYLQRLEATKQFILQAVSQMRNLDVIPLEKPFAALKMVPLESLAMGLLYSLAFALSFVSTVRFFAAQVGRVVAEIRGVAGGKHRKVANDKWRETSWGAAKQAMFTVPVLLWLDTRLELLLVQLFMTAGFASFVLWGSRYWLENFFGDVQIYATYNANSKFSEARDKATTTVSGCICEALRNYDRVIVVGHSLGSVVALHSIRHLMRQAGTDEPGTITKEQAAKLAALVTIGSPLRKFRQLFAPQAYKWPFVEFNINLDRKIFLGDDTPEESPDKLPWFNFWYSSDIFADRLSYIPIGDLKVAIQGREKGTSIDALVKSASPADYDKTGFRVGATRDKALHFRAGIWTHSDYWLDPKFVDSLVRMTQATPEELRRPCFLNCDS